MTFTVNLRKVPLHLDDVAVKNAILRVNEDTRGGNTIGCARFDVRKVNLEQDIISGASRGRGSVVVRGPGARVEDLLECLRGQGWAVDA